MRELTMNEQLDVSGGWRIVSAITSAISAAKDIYDIAKEMKDDPNDGSSYDGNTSGSGQSTNPNAFGA